MGWHFQPIFSSYLLALGAGLVLLAALLLPLYRKLSSARRWTLVALRVAVTVLIVLCMLRPTHLSSTAKRQSAVLLVLLDQSRSMQLQTETGGQSRWQAQTGLLRSAEPLLKDLGEDLEIKIYGYDDELQVVPFVEARLALPETPGGEQTDVGTSLYEAVRREHGNRLAGVVLLGDGAQTVFDPEVDLSSAGRELARLGYPLYTIAFGPAGDAAQSKDVAVEQLPEQYTVFVKNELQIRGLLRVRGYVNQDIPVKMIVQQPDGQTREYGPVQLQARQDGEQVPIEMPFIPQEPGQYKVTVEAAEQPSELVSKNNRLSAFVTVLEGGLRVLYLEGSHRNEVRFLRRTLVDSPDIQLNFDLLEASDRRNWPVDLSYVWQEQPYDAYIIGDLDAAALGAENLKKLAAAVAEGKGLMMIGGLHSFGPGGYRNTPLAEALPIVMERFEKQDFDQPIRKDLHLAGKIRMEPTRPHPVTLLAPAATNVAAWQQLPPLRGANRFADVKRNPGVQVLAQTPDGAPLLVASEYGGGRVLASAVDSTWVWAMRGFDQQHRRYWRQCILWLVRRDDLNRDDVWVKLEQRRYRVGSRVTWTAGLKSPSGTAEGAALEAVVQMPDGTQQTVAMSQADEQFLGSLPDVQAPGDYLLEVTARLDDKLIGVARANFQVMDEDLELNNPAAEPDQLARLAAMTSEFGGRFVAPEQFLELLADIKKKPPELEVEVETKWQLGSTAVSAWIVFLLLAAFLISEWGLRKRWGLV